MPFNNDDIRQDRVEAAVLAMHREAARGMRLFPKDRFYKPYEPPGLRRLRASRHLLKGRYPFLRLRAAYATIEDIEMAFEHRYNRFARRSGDAEWFRDRWLEGVARVGRSIPYTEAFSQGFPHQVQQQPLWRLNTWLRAICQAWPTAICDRHDYDYLIDLLQEPLLSHLSEKPESLKRAIEWLVGKQKNAATADMTWPNPVQAHDAFLALFIDAEAASYYERQVIALLVEWEVVSPEAPHLWQLENLQGKARSVKSAFPAIYEALVDTHKMRLLRPQVWSPVFSNRFQVKFSLKHASKKPHDRGAAYDWYYKKAAERFRAA